MPRPTPAATRTAQAHRNAHRQSDAPRLRDRIAAAWRGQESLSWTFWRLTVIGSAVLTAVMTAAATVTVPFVLAANRSGGLSNSLALDVYSICYVATWLAFAVLCAVAVWRCSKNASTERWTYVARTGVVLWLVWHWYGATTVLVASFAAYRLPELTYAKWAAVVVIAIAAVAKASGGIRIKPIFGALGIFAAAGLLPFLAAAIYLGGWGIFTSGEGFMVAAGWGVLLAMFFVFPALGLAALGCFLYASRSR